MNRLFRLVLGMAVAAGLTLYPSTAQWFSNRALRQNINAYSREVTGTPAALSQSSELVAAARDYNSRLAAGKIALTNETTDELYQSLLQVPGETSTKLMGYLKIPAIGLHIPFYHGTTDDVLEHRAGHIYGTSLPVGGPGTHAALSAHNGLPHMQLFTHLPDMREGDYFSLNVAGGELWYQVARTLEVDPHAVDAILPEPGRDLVTLVTCVPVGVNNRRLLVTGERSGPPPQEVLAGVGPWGEAMPWWAVWFAGVVAGTWAFGRYVLYRKDYETGGPNA